MTNIMKPHTTLGQNLRALRERRGFKLRELAEAMREHNGGDALGLDYSELSRLERGRRQVTVEQWLLLAAALDCPPLLLVIPLGSAETLEVTATSELHPHLAWKWLVGDGPLASTDRQAIHHRNWQYMRVPLTLYQQLAEWQDPHEHHLMLHGMSLPVGSEQTDQPGHPLPRAEAEDYYRPLVAILNDMAKSNVEPPAFDPWVVGRLAQLGLHPDALGVRGAPFSPSMFEDYGPPVIVRHPALVGVEVELPAEGVDDYEAAGWRRIEL